ncbi:MAG: rRNA pseudouridine synthase [Lachnospiraceae bacterium]|nr:rRNA pseudouridine synthase [Lachnospiraceae bacterium]
MKPMRLDKFLCELGIGTRSEVKNKIKNGLVQVEGVNKVTPEYKLDIEKDKVYYNGSLLQYAEFEYYMLNKPAGCVSATSDNLHKTVLELIDTKVRKDLFPVGRLDIDTEGLLLITNDGALAHQLLSPKKHVDKTYYAEIEGMITNEDVVAFKEGLDIGENTLTLPAKLVILESGTISKIEVTIQEGKYHQVKRMFEAVGKRVVYLKRLSMGTLTLDETLKPGEYRQLTPEEIEHLIKRQDLEDNS